MACGGPDREQGYEDERFQTPVSQNLHCVICFNVFKDPVMCQHNEHHFCRPCITKHLANSQACPTCKDELTLETIKPAQRFVKECLYSLNIRCNYFNRGCHEFVLLDNLQNHVMNCGFRPVICEECRVEINKRGQTHHESNVCEFRKLKCQDCVEVKKGVALISQKLYAMNGEIKEIKMNQSAVKEEMKVMRDSLTEIKDMLTILTKHVQSSDQVRKEEMSGATGKDESDLIKKDLNILIASGCWGPCAETFSWSKWMWTPLQAVKQCRSEASSCVFENQMILTENWDRNRPNGKIKALHINPVKDSEIWTDFQALLPGELSGHTTAVYKDRLIVIGGDDGSYFRDSIHEALLVPPYSTKTLTRMRQGRYCHGAQLFDDQILICGGSTSALFADIVDTVELYDIVKNKCKLMPSLPYAVSDMATVRLGDEIAVIGGRGKKVKALSSVVMYNVKTGKNYFLPEMKYQRKKCVAVVVENKIVVMGGCDEQEQSLESVEMFNFSNYSWIDLPPMTIARYKATAIVC